MLPVQDLSYRCRAGASVLFALTVVSCGGPSPEPAPPPQTSQAEVVPSAPPPAAQTFIVPSAPPPAQTETVPPPPSTLMVWEPGYWSWAGQAWAWVPGHYAQRPRPTADWVPGQWVQQAGSGWIWVPGHWT